MQLISTARLFAAFPTRNLKDPKFFLKDEGIKQHFQTIYRERFSDKILSNCEKLMKDLHGEETIGLYNNHGHT